jgi:Xaa-Pro aminopeptidase
MIFAERLAEIRDRVHMAKLDQMIALHDGAHFIEKPDPVKVLIGFKALGPGVALLDCVGAVTLVVTPSWDAARAIETCRGVDVIPAEDAVDGLRRTLKTTAAAVGVAAPSTAPYAIAKSFIDLVPHAQLADAVILDPARRKTDTELADVREAARVAELGFQRLKEIARPGMSEDELAVELRWHSKSLGGCVHPAHPLAASGVVS